MLWTLFFSFLLFVSSVAQTEAASLEDDYALLKQFATGAAIPTAEIGEVLPRLGAANVVSPEFFSAIDALSGPKGAGSSIEGLPTALALGEFALQRDAGSMLNQIGGTEAAKIRAAAKAFDERAAIAIRRVTALPASAARDRLVLRLQAIRALGLIALDPVAAQRTATSLLGRSVSGPDPDSRTFALSLHVLSWAQEQSGSPASSVEADVMAGWLRRASRIFPPADPQVAAAAIDVLDKAQEGDRAELEAEALRMAQPALDAVPDRLTNVGSAQEVLQMVEALHDPDLVYKSALRYAKGLLASDLMDEAARTEVLQGYDLGDIVEHDVLIAALGQALAQTRARTDHRRERAVLGFALAKALAGAGRSDELAIQDASYAASGDTRRAVEVDPPDVGGLVKAASRANLLGQPADAQALFERAVSAIEAGAPADDADQVAARLDLVRQLEANGFGADAVASLRRFSKDIGRLTAMNRFARKAYFEQAAQWSELHGLFEAVFYREAAREQVDDADWDKVEAELSKGTVSDDLRSAFVGAVQSAAGNPALLRRKLDLVAPRYAGALAQASADGAVAMFARPYSRALSTLGQSRLSEAAAGAEALPYGLFCSVMIDAGDRRFLDGRTACPNSGRPAANETSERERLAGAMAAPAGASRDDAAICAAWTSIGEGARNASADLTRARLWSLVDAIRQRGSEPFCAGGSAWGASGVLSMLAASYVAASPALAFALYGEAETRNPTARSILDAVAAALLADNVDQAVGFLRRGMAAQPSAMALATVLTLRQYPASQTARVVRGFFPDAISVTDALDAMAKGAGASQSALYDRGIAAATAALVLTEQDGWSDALDRELQRRAAAPSDSPSARAAAAVAAVAHAWMTQEHSGPDAAAEPYRTANALIAKAIAGDIPVAVQFALGQLRLTVASRPESPAPSPDIGPEIDRLRHLRTKDWAVEGSPFDGLDGKIAALVGASEPPRLQPAEPFGATTPPTDPTGARKAVELVVAALEARQTFAATEEFKQQTATVGLADLFVVRSMDVLGARLGSAWLGLVPADAIPALIAFGKSESNDRQRAERDEARRRAAETSSAPDADAARWARQRWIVTGRRLHMALSVATVDAELDMAAHEAEAAWRDLVAAKATTSDAPAPSLDIADIQATLSTDEAIVSYLPDLLGVALVRKGEAAIVPLNLDPKALAKDIKSYREQLEPRHEGALDLALAHHLYDELIGPLGQRLEGVGTVFLDLPDSLTSLPFAALVRSAPDATSWSTTDEWTPDWLGSHLALEIVPDPSVVAFARRARRPARPEEILAAGDPVLPERGAGRENVDSILSAPARDRPERVRDAFERLGEAASEIRAAAEALPGHAVTLEGPAFTNSHLAQALTPATTTVLLATHAAAAIQSNDAVLVTTPLDANDTGVMDSEMISTLRLDAELVILSACQTGAAAQGQSSFGALTSAFETAGARRVMATLWPVDSAVAPAVTVGAIDGMIKRHLGAAAALSAAMRDVASGRNGRLFRHPRAWASFILVGEP